MQRQGIFGIYMLITRIYLWIQITDKGKVIKPKKNVSFSGTAVSHTDSILFDKRETTQFLKF